MIAFNTKSLAGSYTVLRNKSFICAISTLPGLWRGTVAIMRANADGEIVKWPPVGKAYFKRGMTREQRDAAHDYISGLLDEVGENGADDFLGGSEQLSLVNAMEGVFSIVKTRGVISRYVIDDRYPTKTT